MEVQQLLELLNKEKENNLSEQERQKLEDWYNSLNTGTTSFTEDDPNNLELSEQMLLEFREKWLKPAGLVHKISFIQKIMRAAAIVIGISLIGAVYLLFFNKPKQETVARQYQKFKSDVAPPANTKAVLTLADGSKISLDSISNGTLAVQGKMNVIKQADGLIAYQGSAAGTVSYNTLTVPRGSKPMKLLLADGSQVWLNVASSITYPTTFAGKERRVKINGEAYFEVAKNPGMPFYVTHEDMNVKVLGTHFNVNTYDDEKEIKITLLEGSVHVSKGNENSVLKPGQQAEVNNSSSEIPGIKVLHDVNAEEVMAWKNGRFYFDGTDIKIIMRQIEKWYNVDVEFHSDIKYSFVANISRTKNVSELLKILQLTDLVHFEINGNKIIVMK
jgi:ferric-dicitrate binding protein FerR (iron transport regulator)